MRYLIFCTAILAASVPVTAELRVPAATAYFDPDNDGARITDDVIDWKDQSTNVLWYGQIRKVGPLRVSVELNSSGAGAAQVSLTVGRVETSGKQTGQEDSNRNRWSSRQELEKGTSGLQQISFPEVTIAEPGYYEFRLQSRLNEGGSGRLKVGALILNGKAAEDAHFNLKPRRNAASVHLTYPVDAGTKVSAFYCEMTGVEDPLWTYYMACGWHRGYFGMQVNSPTERRIIFSVWDSGGEAIDRKKVGDENRVQLIAKGDGVYSGDFGNEGTGGHSHLKYGWKTGEKQKFLVTAEPVSETHTVYAGYYFHPDSKKWMLISSWKAPKEGGYMRGLYSFSENFIGRNGNVVRKALYGNQWIRTAAGEWKEITTAKFSYDATGKADRLDRFMGVEQGQFFLSHGGFVEGFTEFGVPFDRVSSGQSPADMPLPPLPPLPAAK